MGDYQYYCRSGPVVKGWMGTLILTAFSEVEPGLANHVDGGRLLPVIPE